MTLSEQATQIRCPFCNAPSAASAGQSATCEYCLQPFSVHDAAREQARLTEEIRAWVEQRVGALGGGGTVDAASRSYLFQSRILPDVRREVDRALEWVGSYGQHPLLMMPMRTPTKGAMGIHPLLQQRAHILGLKGLRARLGSDSVTTFVQTDGDRSALAALDLQLGTVFHLSNVVDASQSRSAAGYAAARKNLESLADQTRRDPAQTADPGRATYAAALADRFASLGSLAALIEKLASAIPTPDDAAEASGLAHRLEDAASRVMASRYAPMESMPTALGVQAEAAGARALATWLAAYDAIASRSGAPFAQFVSDLEAVTGGPHVGAEQQLAILEGVAAQVQGIRGSLVLPTSTDVSWIAAWGEQARAKRSLGMFGADERVAEIAPFLLPVWVAEVSFTMNTGTVFSQGSEARAMAVVEACAPAAQKVVVLAGAHHAVSSALGGTASAAELPSALVASGRATAHAVIEQAMRSRPGVIQPRVTVRGLALLPAASVVFTGGASARGAVVCLAGHVPVDEVARTRIAATGHLLARYP
jgi:hypothetical protein